MCGRFTLVTNLELWNARFQIEVIPFDMQPRYNIAPGQLIPAIISDQGKRRIGQLKWGLVPSWAQDEKSGYKMINARSETLTEKPAFRRLFERKRCIIPADGFYEWQQRESGKQAMRIMMKTGEPFAFAGLFDTWTSPEGEKLHSCTIITTKPNDVVADIHDRMPVILNEQDEAIWLDREKFDADLLQSLLVPYDHEQMKAYPVPAMVGSPKNDMPECIQEIANQSLF
ncbi:SOS response-associated peptidase [Brevibacillus brevis]|uniref:SOS response-associated peptidase n=1 Tax=Brevibacillus brevis TaxID=1393 RepID=UPI00115ADB5D|nr:SOS response-associated peptidase [Lysinibacillus sp. SDF0063]TQR38516.1 SOS response-associated peptidase [Lysinibacillus sp. SDF0063]